MQRLQRFAHNAGTLGALQTLAVTILMVFAMARDVASGDWVMTLPIVVDAFGVAYMIRDFLVNNIDVMRRVMNAFVVAGIIFFILSTQRATPPSLWLRLTLAACVGLYIGCYFWMLSDQRILRVR